MQLLIVLRFALCYSRAFPRYSRAFRQGWVHISLWFMMKGTAGRFNTDHQNAESRKSPESLDFSHRKSTHELYHFVST